MRSLGSNDDDKANIGESTEPHDESSSTTYYWEKYLRPDAPEDPETLRPPVKKRRNISPIADYFLLTALIISLVIGCSMKSYESPSADSSSKHSSSSSSSVKKTSTNSKPSSDKAAKVAEDGNKSASSNANGTDEAKGANSALADKDANATENAPSSEAEAQAELEDVSESVPHVNMDGALIDSTWLGPHDNVRTDSVLYKNNKVVAQVYEWMSRNGKDDLVFYAAVYKDKVVWVKRGNPDKDYWPKSVGLPDLYASGEPKNPEGYVPPKPEPGDYDDPYEYEQDLESWQKHTGDTSGKYEDPLDDWDLDQ